MSRFDISEHRTIVVWTVACLVGGVIGSLIGGVLGQLLLR